jgi:hypothetical protein
MEDEIEESTSLWNKKQDDITVGESMKLSIGAAVVGTLAPVVAFMIAGSAVHLWEKYKDRKKNKLKLVNNEEN